MIATMLAQFHFLRPWWLLLACAWLPLLIWQMRRTRRGAVLGRLADAVLLPYLLVGTGKARQGAWWLAGLAGVLVTLALAGPTWQRLPQPLYSQGAAQVVVVSLSRRMLARDVQPDRMQRVRFKVHDLLHANKGGRNGLVAYAGAAFTVAPLTTDAHALDDLVDALAPDVMPVPGDAPAKGIAQGVKLLEHGDAHNGSLVLVTDKVNAAAIAAAREARTKGIRLSVLGVGTTRGVPVHLPDGQLLTDAAGNIVMAKRDDASLRALARAGGGIYVPMHAGHADVTALMADLRTGHAAVHASSKGDHWRDMGPWLLLPLLLLAAVSFRRGWLLVLPLVLLPCVSLPVQAADMQPARTGSVAPVPVPLAPGATSTWSQRWSALWRNPDQRAARALAEGHPRQAESLARSPDWRGAAAYRMGDYAASAKAYARASGPNAAYNLGNALARQGHYQQAIRAYDKALKLDPGMADARANRKAVRKWLRKHKPPPKDKSSRHAGSRSNGQQGKSQGMKSSGKSGGGRHGPARASTSPASASSSQAPARAASIPAPAQAASTRQPASSAHARSQPAHAGGSHQGADQRAPDAGAAEREQAAARRASRALRRQLRGKTGQRSPAPSFNLGQAPAHAGSVAPLPESMQRALESVADNPGGLLRREFQLEYRKRQLGKGDSGP
ncbi:MAG TPA: tetratricopeptide repeat protein [Rhodanobacteraceae bacterium]